MMHKKTQVSSIDKSITEYETVRLIIDFTKVGYFISDKAGLEEPTDDIMSLIKYFVMFVFKEYQHDDLNILAHVVGVIDIILGGLFENHDERSDVHDEIVKKVVEVVKFHVPSYGRGKETNNAFIEVEHVSDYSFVFTIECRILR